MRTTLLCLCLLAMGSLQAQFWVTNVGTDPDPATACGPTNLVIDGNLPGTNWAVSTLTAAVSGSTIDVTIVATSFGIGIPVITPFNTTVDAGTLSEGTYTVIVDYTAGGNMEVSTYTITVDSCAVSACGPDPTGLMTSVTSTGVDFSWNPVAGSIGCQVRGRPAGTSSYTNSAPIFGSEPTSYSLPSSVLSTGDYDWGVRCACSTSPLIATNWSSSTFNWPFRLAAEQSDVNLINSVADNFIYLSGDIKNQPYQIIDIMGAVHSQGTLSNQIPTQDLATGYYFLLIEEESGRTQKSFVVN